MRYLLDTNVISETRKPRPHGAVSAWMSTLVPAQITIAAWTFGEIQDGVERIRKNDPERAMEIERWLDELESTATIVPLDAQSLRVWARIMVGKPTQLRDDALIAAVAITNALTVATRNVKDFIHFDVPLVNPFESR